MPLKWLYLFISTVLLKQMSVTALCGLCMEDGFDCPSDHFSCYRDCFLIDEWYCDSKQKKCLRCQDKQSLCGNDSMPVECRLFCHLQQHQQQPPSCDTYLSLESTIGISAGVSVIAFFLGRLTSSVCPDVARKFMSRCKKTRTDDLESDENGNETNPKAQAPKSDAKNGKDLDLQKPLLAEKAKQPASLPSSGSAGSQMVDTDDLNITSHDVENAENESGQGVPEGRVVFSQGSPGSDDRPRSAVNTSLSATEPPPADSPNILHPATALNDSKPELAIGGTSYPPSFGSRVHSTGGGPQTAQATSGASARGRTPPPSDVQNDSSPPGPTARDRLYTLRQNSRGPTDMNPSSDDLNNPRRKKPLAINTQNPTSLFRLEGSPEQST